MKIPGAEGRHGDKYEAVVALLMYVHEQTAVLLGKRHLRQRASSTADTETIRTKGQTPMHTHTFS